MPRCALGSFEGVCNFCERLFAGHSLENAEVVFRPRSPDGRVLATYYSLGHTRSYSITLRYERRYACFSETCNFREARQSYQ
jgi:hypothetical protein